ncbi:MAG: hypothetical protein P1V51_06325 [Deltaproteobacteria bacterium]|nr:hypothetical protein [Deltaproteobacteria bacterium]
MKRLVALGASSLFTCALALSPALAEDVAAAPEAAAEAAPEPAAEAPAEAPAAEAPAGPATVEEFAAEADRLWGVRDATFAGKNNTLHTELLEKALEKHPGEFELLWRMARIYWWRADVSPDEKTKSAWGKKAMEKGDEARALQPKRVEGHYFAAIGTGAWSQGMGIAKALWKGLEGKFNERLDTAIGIDSSFDCGGPNNAKGRYFDELPWPKHDFDKSIEWLNKTIAICPKNPRTHLFLADAYHKEGKDEEAKKHLEIALKSTRAGFPQDPGAVGIVVKWAKDRQKDWK